MSNQELEELKQRYVVRGAASSVKQYAARAENAEIWDEDGHRLIDFAGGIGVLNIGHRHPDVVKAVKEQLDKVMHTAAGVITYGPYVKLAERLCQITPTRGFERKALLVNSGAEALENAVKIARAATGRSGVITFEGGFHGRTLLTLAMTGKVWPYKGEFGPMPGEVFHVPFPNAWYGVSKDDSISAIQARFRSDISAERVAAIVIEPVQGEGGFYPAPATFLRKLRELCDQHGIMLIVDEVQSGFARTGRLFAIEHSGVQPDIMTMAKSLADGMPLAAVVGDAKVMDASGPGSLGGTYGGNPLSCAAALAVLDVIQRDGILEKSVLLGDALITRFRDWESRFSCVAHGRHLGAMAAFELMDNNGNPSADRAKALTAYAHEHGLILLSCGGFGNTIRILVPLTVEKEVLEEGLVIIENGLATFG